MDRCDSRRALVRDPSGLGPESDSTCTGCSTHSAGSGQTASDASAALDRVTNPAAGARAVCDATGRQTCGNSGASSARGRATVCLSRAAEESRQRNL